MQTRSSRRLANKRNAANTSSSKDVKSTRSKSPATTKRRASTSKANPKAAAKEAEKAKPTLTPRQWAALNPKTKHYEFGGPLGAFAMVTCLPLLVLLFAFGCDSTGYEPLTRGYRFISDLVQFKFDLDMLISMLTSWNPTAFFCFIIFSAQLVTFTMSLPGEEIQGTELRDGSKLTYRLNGLSVLQTSMTMILMTSKSQGLYFPIWVADNFRHFAVASLFIAFLVSIIAYLSSFRGQKLLALGGNTGNTIYDFMIGRELNPRINTFDVKYFTELRPGLIAWFFLNICMAIKQYSTLQRLTNSMILVVLFQAFYILDALWNEASILSTMDITTDGFGFMLAFGNFCWVPMMYSLQARYLSDFPLDLPYWLVAVVITLEVGGYYIFRASNSQKDSFRQKPDDPKNKDLEYITTRSGSRLLTSGWWGKARHINYLGDWMMSIAWCLPCGFSSVIPWFYCIYFAILLIHRERRDDAKCRDKYGKDWDRYCEKVPYRIVPGVY
ncbi:ergosterol biosynthesis ERG4/ERG24 [Absidia repens]|uniref:Delta(14)-sterol reductase ERG24 n=1 Tax=Absidia repens TaxID=90262 RepID=A0A1X2I4J0_9FUNG|nr:ergosterol biosynthesis ERG4/ERG24 [Absidia repens]